MSAKSPASKPKRELPEGIVDLDLGELRCTDVWAPDEASQEAADREMEDEK